MARKTSPNFTLGGKRVVVPDFTPPAKETLGQKQRRFTLMTSFLIQKAYSLGYGLSFGDAYRSPKVPYGLKNSLHRKRLAIDLNLFKDGDYLRKTSDHTELGQWWESIGGTWGGRFNDGNHYSLQHGKVK